jgi:tripartite-type tricarboxylate transporter receptor subunit TctC
VTTRSFSRRNVLTGAATLSTAAILPRTSLGADWRPTETVRIIVPAAPGGTTDVMGRLLAAHLQIAWGQSAIVENRSGGGGTIGTTEVVRNKGDGHTILVGNPGPNAIAYTIFRSAKGCRWTRIERMSGTWRTAPRDVPPSSRRKGCRWR